MNAPLRQSPLPGTPPRSLDSASVEYFGQQATWSLVMVRHCIEGIRSAQAQGRPVYARKQAALMEQYLSDFRKHNRERWNAKRRLRIRLFDEL